MKAKKASANDKVQRLKTGGGTFTTQFDEVDKKLLAVLGHRVVPLYNEFDCDAKYNDEAGRNFYSGNL